MVDHHPDAKPLTGVRVLDSSRYVAGPIASFFLASMGAEVISIEQPSGVSSRGLAPFVYAEGGGGTEPRADAVSIAYAKRYRGKRSVSLALDTDEGREIARRLAAKSDVFLENFRPGVMERLGLGYETLSLINPRLVYCSISGFGQQGPRRLQGAMDAIIQALSGLLAKTGPSDGDPVKVGTTIGDFMTGTFGAMGVLGALHQRHLTGRGQLVDVAMLDPLTALVWDEPVDHYETIGLPVRTGNADPRAPLSAVFESADGHIATTITSDEQWEHVAPRIGKPEWVDGLTTFRERSAQRDEINAAFAAWARTEKGADIEAFLGSIGMPAAVVRDPVATKNDAQLQQRRLFETLRHPWAPVDRPSPYTGARLPIAFDGRVDDLSPAEPLGASTDAVLSSLLGLTTDELTDLRIRGIV